MLESTREFSALVRSLCSCIGKILEIHASYDRESVSEPDLGRVRPRAVRKKHNVAIENLEESREGRAVPAGEPMLGLVAYLVEIGKAVGGFDRDGCGMKRQGFGLIEKGRQPRLRAALAGAPTVRSAMLFARVRS